MEGKTLAKVELPTLTYVGREELGQLCFVGALHWRFQNNQSRGSQSLLTLDLPEEL